MILPTRSSDAIDGASPTASLTGKRSSRVQRSVRCDPRVMVRRWEIVLRDAIPGAYVLVMVLHRTHRHMRRVVRLLRLIVVAGLLSGAACGGSKLPGTGGTAGTGGTPGTGGTTGTGGTPITSCPGSKPSGPVA